MWSELLPTYTALLAPYPRKLSSVSLTHVGESIIGHSVNYRYWESAIGLLFTHSGVGGTVSQFDSFMAKKTLPFAFPTLRVSSVTCGLSSALTSPMTVISHILGEYKCHSHAALASAQVREDIAAHILEGKQVFEKALQRTEIVQFNDAALNEDYTYSEQVRSIVEGVEELREVRKSFKAKLPQRPVEPAPAPIVACPMGGLFSNSS